MRHGAVFALILALAAPAAWAESASPENPWVSEALAGFRHGVYCALPPVDVIDAPDTAAGVVNLTESVPEFLVETTLVPAALGIAFGVVARAKPGPALDPVEITITHPPYTDSGIAVERWQTVFNGGSDNLVGFSFEVTSELVPGPWEIEAAFDGVRLFAITFEVVPAAVLPEIAGACSGVFLS